uniref:Peptidase S1 domain-containing protein n=1 Tax=Panagrolaimus sp. ES5 TaxID=591445 RepID=A0AC34FCR6_9BILA
MQDRFFMSQWDGEYSHGYDIVILKTKVPINFAVGNVDKAVISITSPSQNIDFLVPGYGFVKRNPGQLPNRLLFTTATYFTHENCQQFFKRPLSITEVCSTNLKSTAKGDSGSPLVGRDMFGVEKVYVSTNNQKL